MVVTSVQIKHNGDRQLKKMEKNDMEFFIDYLNKLKIEIYSLRKINPNTHYYMKEVEVPITYEKE